MTDLYKELLQYLQVVSWKGYPTYIPTGFKDLDNLIHGLRNSNLIVISSEPGHGKTTFALNMLYNITKLRNCNVLFFTNENHVRDTLFRVMMRQSINDINKDNISDIITKYDDACTLLSTFYEEYGITSIEDIYSAARNSIDNEPKVICIDNLQSLNLLDQSNLKAGENEIHYIVYQLKELALQLNIPVVLLSNRYSDFEDYYYGNNMLKYDQEACMEVADVFIKISRPEARHIIEDANGNSLKNREIVEVIKNKNGKCGEFLMKFDKETGLIYGDKDKKYMEELKYNVNDSGFLDTFKENKVPY